VVTPLVHKVFSLVVFLYDLTEMIVRAFRNAFSELSHGRRPVFSVYLRQVYFTGLEASRIVLLTAVIIGTVVVAKIVGIAGEGSGTLSGRVMIWIVIRELGPLLTAIIIIARSGTAIAAELSQMKIGGETDYLESMGIPVAKYLIMPRIFGVATAMLILTIYFDCAALLGGFGVVSLFRNLSWEQYTQGLFAALTLTEIAASLVKCVLTGLTIGATCCMQGLSVEKSVTQIPVAATKAVMYSLFFLFTFEGLASLIFLLF